MSRLTASTPELDRREQQWWSEFGELEDRYCWVQTPEVQRIIRRGYLNKITELVGPSTAVLELGCGTGWLAILLLELGVGEVHGSDFSVRQIEAARAAAAAAGLSDRSAFVVAGTDDEARLADVYDVVVLHAFLHHLSRSEVIAVLEGVARRLGPRGRLVVVEPFHHADGPAGEPASLRLLRRLEGLPRLLAHRRLRHTSPEERSVRDQLARRPSAEPPFGPSPKELPFAPGELEELLATSFVVEEREPAMCMSHLVAQELLIASLSQPRLWSAATGPLLRLAARLDASALRSDPPPRTVWAFETLVCRPRH